MVCMRLVGVCSACGVPTDLGNNDWAESVCNTYPKSNGSFVTMQLSANADYFSKANVRIFGEPYIDKSEGRINE